MIRITQSRLIFNIDLKIEKTSRISSSVVTRSMDDNSLCFGATFPDDHIGFQDELCGLVVMVTLMVIMVNLRCAIDCYANIISFEDEDTIWHMQTLVLRAPCLTAGEIFSSLVAFGVFSCQILWWTERGRNRYWWSYFVSFLSGRAVIFHCDGLELNGTTTYYSKMISMISKIRSG